jgi:queuine/archaeosine tRNA-ribosyltransferase
MHKLSGKMYFASELSRDQKIIAELAGYHHNFLRIDRRLFADDGSKQIASLNK